MSHISQFFSLTLSCAALMLFASCSTDQVRKNQDKLTDSYADRQERREIRAGARQERSNAWFGRIMGQPGKSGDTGLKLPD